jgi:prepilin-type N-terminal cleavage/methylation domain-containing protein
MRHFGKPHCARHRRSRGLTMIELMIVLAVILITSAISMPSFIQAYQRYQVNDAATRMANVIKFTRYEAIRLNTPVNYVIGVTPAGTTIAWTDSNGNGATAGMAGANAADATERQVAFSPNVTLFAAGNVPNTAGLILAAGVGPLIPLSNTNAAVQFDQRGAVNPPPAGALVSYVGSIRLPNAGYRAVILLPSGSMQVWQASMNGDQSWSWNYLH